MESAFAVEHTMDLNNANISPNPLKCPPAPLHQLSPERINQQRMPQSPSLHGYFAENERPPSRDSVSSDVQSKVAFLNGLASNASIPPSPTRQGRGGDGRIANGTVASQLSASNNVTGNSAFQRAIMGYEEAQASLATMTAELERAKEEMALRKKRERILSQRLEDLLEELQATKEKRSRDQESYAKEIKKCRKEAYRAELAVVESRQDLQEVRSELKRCQAELQHEKSEKEKSRQESFERAYALAGTVGELDQLKDKLKAVEKERDAALLEAKSHQVDNSPVKSSCKLGDAIVLQEDMKSVAPTPVDDSQDQLVFTDKTVSAYTVIEERPRPFAPALPTFESIKRRLDCYDKQFQGQTLTSAEEIEFLKQELYCARRKHAEDEDMIHFIHMQCQFKACPCRLAELNGERFVHDHGYEANVENEPVSKKRKISSEGEETPQDLVMHSGDYDSPTPKARGQPVKDDQHFRLPPDPTPELPSGTSGENLQEAVEVPLPAPLPMELDSVDIDPEPTAQLEDITQVLVEPGTASKPFSFSTSTTSNTGFRATTPSLRHAESATAALDHDLFDLSPPKQILPRRPSTAMGILTIESPIRLVPDSPRWARTSEIDSYRSTTPPLDPTQTFTQSITTTTKVALKDSPPRSSLHKRAQSRPNLRSHSPLAASVMSHDDEADRRSAFVKETSASPAASTLFPVTPLHKPSRSQHSAQQLQSQSRTQDRSAVQATGTTTTTTRVPLRDVGQGDDDFSPARSTRRNQQEHAYTEVLQVDTRIGVFSTNAASQANTISVLGNVPGTPISREAALAQIRARRDRARSVNLKRSADTNGGKSPTKPRVVQGVVGGLFSRDKENIRREISQASAPGRIAF